MVWVGLGFSRAGRRALFIGARFICKPKVRRSWKGWGTERQGGKECKQC